MKLLRRRVSAARQPRVSRQGRGGARGPPTDPQLDQAAALLADFGRCWEIEPSPAERRKLIAQLVERIWEHAGAIVAVKPRSAFAQYFAAADELARHRTEKCGAEGGSDGGQTPERHPGSRYDSDTGGGWPPPRRTPRRRVRERPGRRANVSAGR